MNCFICNKSNKEYRGLNKICNDCIIELQKRENK